MAKVTWLGQGESGPDQTTQWNTVFKKGEAVEVEDPSIVVRAMDDKFFKVEEEKKPEAEKPAAKPAATATKPEPSRGATYGKSDK